jgi:hypothetical protein
MTYMLLIVENRGQRARNTPDVAHDLYDQMVAFGQGLAAEGKLLASESLRTDDHAVRITAGSGKAQLRDGPFTEAKEMVGGFYLIDVASRDEAIAIASRCPAVNFATVEVRECAPCHVL